MDVTAKTENDALRAEVDNLRADNRRLHRLLMASTALCSAHTAAAGFLAAHLHRQGVSLEEIERLTCGTLPLRRNL